MRACFAFTNAAAPSKPAVLSIFEDIGFWGTQAGEFIASLREISASGKKDLLVEISSPGGDVSHALAMYNTLRASGLVVTTKVMGAAASAASLVFMAGEKRQMPKNTWLMLHRPSTIVAGNEDDMDEAAQMLRKIGGLVRGTYTQRSGMTDAQMTEILSKDSFFSADEAVANGLATEVIEDVQATAHFDMARADFPSHVRAAYTAAAPAAALVRSQGSKLWKELRARHDVAAPTSSAPLVQKVGLAAAPAGSQGSKLWKELRARHARQFD